MPENASKLWKIIQEAGDYLEEQYSDAKTIILTKMPTY